jgi:hypothetical protein
LKTQINEINEINEKDKKVNKIKKISFSKNKKKTKFNFIPDLVFRLFFKICFVIFCGSLSEHAFAGQ